MVVLEGHVLAQHVRGAVETSVGRDGATPARLPAWTALRHADDSIGTMARMTAGVRLVVLTRASAIGIDLTVTDPLSESTVHAGGGNDRAHHLAVEVDGSVVHRATLRLGRQRIPVDLGSPEKTRVVTVWLPHTAAVSLHALDADAPFRPGPTGARRWIHYGSSISHATDVLDPVGGWPIQAARSLGYDLTSLSFAGNAMLDPFVARVIAELPAELITLKVGINPVNGDTFRRRTFIPALHGFLDAVRDGHPRTEIRVITSIACPIHEDATGPTREVVPGRAGATPRVISPGDGSLTLRRTREWIAHAVEVRRSTDDALHLMDGLELLGYRDEARLFDALHPDQDGHDLIAERFARSMLA